MRKTRRPGYEIDQAERAWATNSAISASVHSSVWWFFQSQSMIAAPR